MISAPCASCGLPADEHHDDYPDGAGWFCADCMPGPAGQAVQLVNEWQTTQAEDRLGALLARHAVVFPFRRRRRVAVRGAA